MAQLTIDIPDELAQKLAPFQNQLSEIFANLIATSLLDKLVPKTEVLTDQEFLISPTYLEILDFLINRPTSKQITNFKVSEESQIRLQELLQKNRETDLNPSEVLELNLYEQLDTLMTMMEVRAYGALKAQNVSTSNPE